MRRSDGSGLPSGVRVIGESEIGPRRAVALGVEDGRYHAHVVGATGSASRPSSPTWRSPTWRPDAGSS